ncbi:hypothetical protein [Sphingomonas montanisoli]|uniref:NIPSNAP family protein n=1 Tax=Sphingomonas montanisoli TaxID=2606412 RepID=A0A5D9C8Q8_9SPHN|nr:hypothetical protein [Sphingomonas montanisoli]TZG27687.1 hypothetical protein FYJ91_08945 [Sphingomonas montanisoli]
MSHPYEPTRKPGSYEVGGAIDREALLKPATHTREERIYCHELLDISVKHRRAYLDHFSHWADATGSVAGTNRAFGVWGTIGMSHRWAEGVIMWEWPNKAAMFDGLAGAWSHFHSDDGAGDIWAFAWGGAAEGVTDTQGMDRLMCSTAYSPTMEELYANGVKGEAYLHYHINTPPGMIDDHLGHLESYVPIAERLGLKFVGSYRTLFTNDDQGLMIWALPKFADWPAYEDARRTDKEALEWRAEAAARGVTYDGRVLVGAKSNPLDRGHSISMDHEPDPNQKPVNF